MTNISNINLINCEWTGVSEENRTEGLVEGLKFENTTINGISVGM